MEFAAIRRNFVRLGPPFAGVNVNTTDATTGVQRDGRLGRKRV